MAEVLIVSGSYYPYATANAVCVKKFEEKLIAAGHHVTYCIRKHDLYEEDLRVEGGVAIHTVGKNSDLFFQTSERLGQLDLPNGMKQAFRASYGCFRALMKLKTIGKSKKQVRSAAREHYLHAYAKRIGELIREQKVDLLISVSMPFDSHMAVLRALDMLPEGERPRWMAYCIDAYWSKAGVPTEEIPDMQKEERLVFDRCDQILLLDTIEKDYAGQAYDTYRSKMKALPLPLFDLNQINEYEGGIDKEKDYCDWVFTGTIYDGFRGTEGLVRIFRSIIKQEAYKKSKRIRLHIIGKVYPKALTELKELQKEYPDYLAIYGRRPYSYAKGSMKKADVLINLANDDTNQIPSKIFEYMMCLKPIINIYRLDGDVGTSYLKKYPLAFNYQDKPSEDEKNMQELTRWMDTVFNQHVTTEELRKIYHDVTSDVVAQRFLGIAERLL